MIIIWILGGAMALDGQSDMRNRRNDEVHDYVPFAKVQ
jgi:hypothetical protein